MQFFSDIKIDGFMNIENRQWTRMVRREEREAFNEMWLESHQADDILRYAWAEDIFDLKKLFGMEPYDEFIPFGAENWDAPDKIQVSIVFVILHF